MMHGLVNKLIQCFVEDTYGTASWDLVVRECKLGFRDFEAMLIYDDALTENIIEAAGHVLGKKRNPVLEDIGTYLVTHENMDAVRRLLRFGGATFEEFLFSLDDLPERVKLAIPDLEMPTLELREYNRHHLTLTCIWRRQGYGCILLGMLRAMADDYGVLVFLDVATTIHSEFASEVIKIELFDVDFAQGRSFSLGERGVHGA